MLSKVGKIRVSGRTFHCDFSNHLFMGHLSNHLLNAADFHSNDKGFGMNYLSRYTRRGAVRLVIEMECRNRMQSFAVETWVGECDEVLYQP